jgi:hypothetical protein
VRTGEAGGTVEGAYGAAFEAPLHRPSNGSPPQEREGSPPRTPHCFTSMAERRPSASRLKAMEVMKIITPGRAASQGWT